MPLWIQWSEIYAENARLLMHELSTTKGVETGGVYIGIYTPQNQSTLQIFMWLLVVFFSLTQDKFDMVPVCALARVSFTYLHTTIYTPPMKFLATPLSTTCSHDSTLLYSATVRLADVKTETIDVNSFGNCTNASSSHTDLSRRINGWDELRLSGGVNWTLLTRWIYTTGCITKTQRIN